MSTWISLILILGLILVIGLMIITFKSFSRGWSFKILFKDFKRKMWMTISLGGIFFSLYLLSVCLGVYLVHQSNMNVFLMVYQNPVKFVYGGLCLFAALSLTIYLARMIIKYLYLTRGKE